MRLRYVFLIGCLIGALQFILFYGINCLDPCNIAWLVQKGGDTYQHYLGWIFFNNESWTWPLGKINNLLYPLGYSVVFMDSIPWWALPFKFICHLIGYKENIQYLGLYGITCFSLQGGFAALLLRRFINTPWVCFLVVPIYVYCDPMITRMFGHTALGGGQFLILASLVSYLYLDNYSLLTKFITWSGLCSIAACNHPYIGFMVGIIFLFFIVHSYRVNQSLYKEHIQLFWGTTLIATIAFYICGGFVALGGSGMSAGSFSMNINSLFDSYGQSKLFPSLAKSPVLFYGEGKQFLGAGVICFLPFAIGYFIRRVIQNEFNFKANAEIILFCVLLLFLALGPNIYFGDMLIFSYKLPSFLNKVLGMFRSSGRLFWPVYYIIITFVIVYVYRLASNKRFAGILLLGLCAFQLWDNIIISEALKKDFSFNSQWRDITAEARSNNQSLHIADWNMLLEHIGRIDTFTISGNGNATLRLVELAAIKQLQIDTTYGSHMDLKKLNAAWNDVILAYTLNQSPPRGHLYISLTTHSFAQVVPYLINKRTIWFFLEGYLCAVNRNDVSDMKDFPTISDLRKIKLTDYLAKVGQNKDNICIITATNEGLGRIATNDISYLKKLGLKTDFDAIGKGAFIAVLGDGLKKIIYEGADDQSGFLKYDLNANLTGERHISVRSLGAVKAYNGKYEDSVLQIDGKPIAQVNGLTVYCFNSKRGEFIDIAYFPNKDTGFVIPYKYISMLNF